MGVFEKLRRMLMPAHTKKEEEPGPAKTDSSAGDDASKDLPTRLAQENAQRIATLTPRERDTYQLLVMGYTLKETAEQLGIKYSTANTHMTGLYKKLGVNSRAELIIRYKNKY